MLICLQAGQYDSQRLRHNVIEDEPFPVKVTVRSKDYERLIDNEAAFMSGLKTMSDEESAAAWK